MRNDLVASSSKDQKQHYDRFKLKPLSRQSRLHQFSTSGECQNTQAQRAKADIQRMIRVQHGPELPPNHVNFKRRILEKLHKNKR